MDEKAIRNRLYPDFRVLVSHGLPASLNLSIHRHGQGGIPFPAVLAERLHPQGVGRRAKAGEMVERWGGTLVL